MIAPIPLRLREIPEWGAELAPGDCWYAVDTGGWRCRTCGCLWRSNDPTEVQPDGSWSLFDGEQRPGECCDNVAMDLEHQPKWCMFTHPEHGPIIQAQVAPEHRDKRPVVVVLPNGVPWCIHAGTSRAGSGWRVVGEPPRLTVAPSIDMRGGGATAWHGWIRDGMLVTC